MRNPLRRARAAAPIALVMAFVLGGTAIASAHPQRPAASLDQL